MPFKEKTRQWWLNVANRKCQFEFYTEDDGWKECGDNRNLQVHHIRPEGWSLERGENPEENTGMPLCANHHMRNVGTEPHNKGSSFHPDYGEAYTYYKEWKQQEQHMNSITGKTKVDYSTSPFADVGRRHRELSEKGLRYWNSTDEIDEYYEDKMKVKEQEYILKTGNLRPKVKQHPRTDKSRKKRWYDKLFD